MKGFSESVLKRSISILSVLSYFKIKVDGTGKCLCPFHDDKNPSMAVYDEFVYCYACEKGWSAVQFVSEKLGLDRNESIAWLNEQELPDDPGFKPRDKGEYRGPVDRDLVEFWHSCLKDEHRGYYKTERLLTDKTIDTYKLGWRPDYAAYVIPVWEGIPGLSEVETILFRRTEHSWFDSKFIGLRGHTKPTLAGKHLLTKRWVLIVFGAFDFLLATQDGIPVVAPTAFMKKDWVHELDLLQKIDTIYAVLDGTPSEEKAARRMLKMIQKDVKISAFPTELKDYGDYRKEHTVNEFISNILNIKWTT